MRLWHIQHTTGDCMVPNTLVSGDWKNKCAHTQKQKLGEIVDTFELYNSFAALRVLKRKTENI